MVARLATAALMLAALLAAAPAVAEISLVLPAGAERTAAEVEPLASYALPVGAWAAGEMPRLPLEGRLSQTAWRLRDNTDGSLQLLLGFRAQILLAGYDVLFECATDACGGFDFRFAMKLLPEPVMHVDLGDFRYLAARRGEGEAAEHLALVVSRSTGSGFVHLTQVGPIVAGETVPGVAETPAPLGPTAQPIVVAPLGERQFAQASGADLADLSARLEAQGSVALDDLAFETGSATLSPGAYASLAALAGYLAANPGRQVVLVGHTDAVGGLEANIALSRKRAEAVRAQLVEAYGANPAQLGAEGAGWLAPRATNLTPEGRARNRRVEVVLTST